MLQTTELRDVASNVAMHKLFNDLIDKLENVLPLFLLPQHQLTTLRIRYTF